MTKLWAVVCERGAYSDMDHWVVCAYADERLAREHQALLSREVDRLVRHGCDGVSVLGVQRWDCYDVEECELRDALPEVTSV